MKKRCAIAGILVAMLLATSCTVISSTPPPAGKLELLSHSMTKGDLGRVEVNVTVKNVGSTTIELAEVTVKFSDANGTLIETAKDAVMNLKPGESWNFKIACLGAGCDQVKNYEIETLAGTSSGVR